MNKFLRFNNFKYKKTTSSKWIEIDTKQDYSKARSLFKNDKTSKFNLQNMYDAETHYNLFMNNERFSKLLIHYETYKKIKNLKGAIVECGVFKGTSFSRFAMLKNL